MGLRVGAIAAVGVIGIAQAPYRTLDDRFAPPRYSSREAWQARAQYLREHVMAAAGLLPLPEKTPLNASVTGDVTRGDYVVSKVFFESLPGFFVTGNLYRPIGDGPFPAVLSPHGHWTYGRLENSPTASGPGRAIGLARQGFVVFTYDMIGYLDSQQLPHTFGGRREQLWGLSLAGLQLWNSIRALDFLESLPYVKRDAMAATGESGGGTQTFLLAAVDPRVAVAAPVNMISLHMQGGCLCENAPGLRLDTTNVEIAATIAPRPLLMISATGDWTKETIEVEYPAVRSIYQLFGAADRVHAVRIDAEHNYNKASREAMYAWMARWLRNAPADVRIAERSFTVEPLQELLVFHRRPPPAHAVTPSQLTEAWIRAAGYQLDSISAEDAVTALGHVLHLQPAPPHGKVRSERVVLTAMVRPEVEAALRGRGVRVVPIAFTPFDDAAAAKIRHFETYNRTAASQRVADVAQALRAQPGAAIVAEGDAALPALLALPFAPARAAVIDVARFDTSSDDDYLARLFVPGLRRAGGVRTAAALAAGTLGAANVVIHNAGGRFTAAGPRLESRQLAPLEVVETVVKATRGGGR